MDVVAKIREWREEPVQFVRDMFRVEPDLWQHDFLNGIRDNKRSAAKACKGPGKTACLAWAVWWFKATRPHPKVVATSINGPNLRDGLWAELAKWQQQSEWLRKEFTWGAERIYHNRHPETWFCSARKWSESADPSQQANTLAGIHADYVLFVIDEAGGVPDSVVAAAEAGLATGIETKMILAGNPTHLEGPLYRACTQERDHWFVVEITGDPDDPKRSPRIDPAWAQKQIDTYGRDHPWVLVNVYGKFPPSADDTMVSREDAEAASRRTLRPEEYSRYPLVMGVDIARSLFGDRTVYTFRQGRYVYPQITRRNTDLMVTADEVAALIRQHNPKVVFVDQAGMGAGVSDRLRQLGHNIVGVESAGKSPDRVHKNRRAYMWGEMAKWFRGEVQIPRDPELVRELSTPKRRFGKNDDRILVESKEDLKARGVASPDLADSLALTFAAPVNMDEIPYADVRDPYDRHKSKKRHWDFDPYAGRW